ncbi:MAG: RimK family alpha-L-glutamate ligase [Candidatus Bathyarchaeota archaeon]|mgnify:CR=1 FL=1|nr:RimK family alpha-L-glutamate ligase [Candidatus Bathyarchaeota archaeon]MDD4325448.1 RimK family alpha-L-glutamate ligase [Candidatus Bathyarchaeota archaeon]MDI9577400.1 RimK family alpha-L-glutamate ligase [Thermoproteota archaeon]MDT8782830.1 RimK family alpha-L-glutamate ligase [Candidatus Bathyarchaeota archaeon]NLD66789.1 RimK family alpha-L-glutamate ligase [Thermoproteota archaeon]
MSRIACFVEKYNFMDPREEAALLKFKQAAEKSGSQFSFLFRENIEDIPKYDAILIRATTDPLYTSYIVSKTAWELGLKVIDDPQSIKICANKIHQYALFEKYNIPCIPTVFLNKENLHHKNITKIFDTLGKPVVIKAPYTSFSRYVEKAACETSFREVAKRFFKKSDVLAIQKFTPTTFDWRVGVLGGEILYVCKYMIPKGKWKHGAKLRGKPTVIWGRTVSMHKDETPPKLREVALRACSVIGKGLYGVDIKEVDSEFVVVEVNDNPSIYSGYEDSLDVDIYDRIIGYLSA